MRIGILIAFSIIFFGCQSTKTSSSGSGSTSMLLFTVHNDSVSTEEFIYAYKKNAVNSDSTFTEEDITDYLELYKKFKLKIAEAKSRGIDTSASFKREFNTYWTQLKKPYLTDNKVTQQLVEEAYDRFKTEINASHILLKLDENASPEDTLKAYNKLLEIKKKAEEGQDFEKLAKEYSEDPSAKKNGGNLGYFTSFQMVYPFESAAYNTPEGDISSPVRSRFGYHLVKVNDKRPSQGSVTVSHIMIRTKPGEDSTQARNKIFEIHEQATSGMNWEQLVKQFSDDINTKNKAGLLQPFKVGQMPYEFQEAAFSLQEEGTISDPVLTPYGWHIIRLEGKEPLEPLSQLEPTLKSRVKRDTRADLNRKALIQRLKKENGFKENAENVRMLWALADSSLLNGKWKSPEGTPVSSKVLITISEEKFYGSDFIDFVVKNQKPTKGSPEQYLKELYVEFQDHAVVAYEENHLEEKYLDYKMLVKEYREGIMLFQLMEEEVWQKAVDDTVGLKQFYKTHQDKYQWQERIHATIYNASSEDVISEIRTKIEQSDSLVLSKKALENQYNAETPLTLQVDSGKYEKGSNELVDMVPQDVGLHEINHEGRYILIDIKEMIPAGAKELDEIRGLVISDYQNKLEKEWVEELRAKYKLIVNEQGLEYVYDQLEKK